MSEDLISKKELLNVTGISYGQLYRWKRKNIIPEEWFIKKSSYTGQETYFPREKILERIEKIKDMKDNLSLDDLADVFSSTPSKVSLSKDEILIKNIVSNRALEIYESIYEPLEEFGFDNILIPYILDDLLKSGNISFDEGKSLIKLLSTTEFKDKDYEIILLRKFGIGIWVLGDVNENFYIEEEGKIIIKTTLKTFIEELKLKLER
ncbi:YhbD family protein [Clostridium hydrogeniformans]|uniref:YhbD family protein n=1 Tax=Clostridium hydrogeniformans TaxID=349933 RepID=UPI0004818CDA|nr:YhbD family protein [Clostridium hydrogeniformans]